LPTGHFPSTNTRPEFARRNPALLDKRLLSRHYRSSTLAADPARHGWVEPDLAPFPWPAQPSPRKR
jgi:hypothetical protein